MTKADSLAKYRPARKCFPDDLKPEDFKIPNSEKNIHKANSQIDEDSRRYLALHIFGKPT